MSKKIRSLLISGVLTISMGLNVPLSFADTTSSSNITPAQLKTYIDEADDFMIFTNKVIITADTEGNIAAKEALLRNDAGLSSKTIGFFPHASNLNYIEKLLKSLDITRVENGQEITETIYTKSQPLRAGSKLIIDDSKNSIISEDNGNKWNINDIPMGPKTDLELVYKNLENEIDISSELTGNLSTASTKLFNLSTGNTDFKVHHLNAEQVGGDSGSIYLESGDTENKKNIIIVNIDTTGKDVVYINKHININNINKDWGDDEARELSSRVLYNFCNSDGTPFTGTIKTNTLLMGSILAPKADVEAVAGNINGSIFCDEFLGNGCEVHKVDFVLAEKGTGDGTGGGTGDGTGGGTGDGTGDGSGGGTGDGTGGGTGDGTGDGTGGENGDSGSTPGEPPQSDGSTPGEPPQMGDYFATPYIIGAVVSSSILFAINRKDKLTK